MDFPHGETVTRQRGTAVADPYNPDVTTIDWSTPDELDIEHVGFDPGGSLEPTQDARNAVISQPTVYDPSFADVLPGDRIVARGKTYDVEGDPAVWRDHPMTGWSPGQVIRLKRTEG